MQTGDRIICRCHCHNGQYGVITGEPQPGLFTIKTANDPSICLPSKDIELDDGDDPSPTWTPYGPPRA